MTYSVKELFYTLQGEGARTGRAAIFCRFSGCNFWSGLEKDRENATCRFCDTDFVGTDGPGGGKFASPQELARAAARLWQENTQDRGRPYLVCTGGEPLLQLDEPLIEAFHDAGFEVAVETNGSLPVPKTVDWICVSPKSLTNLVQKQGHELKLVYPQENIRPEDVADLAFKHFFLQPMDGFGPDANGQDTEKFRQDNTRKALDYCRRHPQWRLSLQTHKILQIP
ncbi:7-carboxy-7-deazaguanine synthase [Luteithermobacter gelatinilyticus]|uniref:7-carboxy-7-deazaguanine synthase n=1 Tax=Luteithermobacter gelatinilyticus TaxID=2582913 RepID=UPI00110644AF|nr:7-carboxy-7-deazaguanine synthase [Luteithermobacter gelatinilyticus]